MQELANIREEGNIGANAKPHVYEVKAQSRLNIGEKVAFSLAAVFSTAVLVACVMLTIVGFIFSPIADTLVFALLTGAMGLTTYVIWRGGSRSK